MISMVKLRYKRMGKCNRCGACCLAEDPPCPHLAWEYKNGKKIAVCKLYGKPERPERCKWFPEAPPIMFKTCGYYFVDTWENNRIVKPGEI